MSSLHEHVWSSLEQAVIVPGHAVYVGTEASHARRADRWLGTFPGYRGDDEARVYMEHVEAGVLAARNLPDSLLVFSGGQTREVAGPLSEAQSYWFLADQCAWFGHADVKQRAVTEEYARDSFENLLFGIYRFEQCVGRLPERVVVCGFAFKGQRYKDHAKAIHNESSLGRKTFEFEYRSVNDPPYYVLEGPNGSRAGEEKTLAAFESCPLGDSDELMEKRLGRDPFLRGIPYPRAAR